MVEVVPTEGSSSISGAAADSLVDGAAETMETLDARELPMDASEEVVCSPPVGEAAAS